MSLSNSDYGFAGPENDPIGGWLRINDQRWDQRPRIWRLKTEDSEATVNAAGYFDLVTDALQIGDLWLVTQVSARGAANETLVATRWHQIITIDDTVQAQTFATGAAPGGGITATWGGITGTLSAQSDLSSALSGKADSTHTHTGVYSEVGHTHSYAPLSHVGAGGDGQHPDATTGTSGFMAPADKAKLDSVAAGAEPNPGQVSAPEIASGTSSNALRSFSADDVVGLIDAHAAGGGGGTSNAFYIVGGGGATQPTDTLIDIESASLKAQIDVKFDGDTFADAEVLNLTAGAGVQMAVTESPPKQVNITISGADVVATRAALKALLKAGLSDGALRLTSGWNAAGDGVAGAFTWDADGAATADDATIVASDEGGTGRWIRANASRAWDVRWFGARGDGATADAAALNAAATAARAAGRALFVPDGRYMIAAQVDFSGLQVTGASRAGAILDVTGYTTASSPAVYWAGSAASLTTLSAGATIGQWSITVTDDSAVSVGDWLCVYNSADSSWSQFRSYYRAGEHVLVIAKAGAGVLTLAAPLYDTYSSGLAVYKVTPTTGALRNITIEGDEAQSQYCVSWQWARDVLVEGCTLRGSKNAVAAVNRCYGTTIRDCNVLSDDYTGSGTAYGVVFINSGRARVLGGRYQAARHGVAIGGDSAACCVPNRDVVVEDAWLTSTKERSGDVHGNAEACGYRRCLLEGGALIGGHRNFHHNCTIKAPADTANPMALGGTEMLSCDHEITDCVIVGASQNASYASCIDIGGNNTPLQAYTTRPGQLRIHRCRLIVAAGATSLYAVQIRQRGSTAFCALDIRNLTIEDEGAGNVYECALYIDRVSGNEWGDVTIHGIRGGSLRKVPIFVEESTRVTISDVAGTTMDAATNIRRGIHVKDCRNVRITNCHIDTTYWEGLLLQQTAGSAMTAMVSNCSFTGCVTSDGGITSFDRGQLVGQSGSGSIYLSDVVCTSKGALALQDVRMYQVGTVAAANCHFLSASAVAYGDTVTAWNWHMCVLTVDRTTAGGGITNEYGVYRVGADTYWLGLPDALPTGADKVWAT